jgi:hypothetical protein
MRPALRLEFLIAAKACFLPPLASVMAAAYADNARSTSKDNATVRNVLTEAAKLPMVA